VASQQARKRRDEISPARIRGILHKLSTKFRPKNRELVQEFVEYDCASPERHREIARARRYLRLVRRRMGRTDALRVRFSGMTRYEDAGVAISHIGAVAVLVAAELEGVVVRVGEYGEPYLGVARDDVEAARRGDAETKIDILVGEIKGEFDETRGYLNEALRLNRRFLRDVLPSLPEKELPRVHARQILILEDLIKLAASVQVMGEILQEMRGGES